ncbi:MAG: phospholipase A2 [bacterium]
MKAKFGISVLFAVLLSSFLTFYSIPPSGEAAVAPARIVQLVAIAMSRNCEAGVMDQLCSHVTSFLDDESAKAGADLKNCKKNCLWKKNKNDLITAAKKKAKDSCARGEAPNINEINKGLDGNAKDRLKKLYDNNSRLFDGSAKLASKDFDVKSNQSPAITGKSGLVADLKTSEPDIAKIGSATGLGLGGKKLSGETPEPTSQKRSESLLASASSAKSAAPVSTATFSAAATIVAPASKTAATSAIKAAATSPCDSCLNETPGTPSYACMEICCVERGIWCETFCMNYYATTQEECDCCRRYGRTCFSRSNGCECPNGFSWNTAGSQCFQSGDIETGGNISLGKAITNGLVTGAGGLAWLNNWWDKRKHELDELLGRKQCEEDGDECCGVFKYNPQSQCCSESQDILPIRMKTLHDCDVRYQLEDVPFEKKGCSVPGAWDPVLTGLCGMNNKDEPVPGVSFLPACYEHDTCYRTCKPNGVDDTDYKKTCDDKFGKNLETICNNHNLDDEALRWCMDFVSIYYNGADKAGWWAYKGSQTQNCSCCPQ